MRYPNWLTGLFIGFIIGIIIILFKHSTPKNEAIVVLIFALLGAGINLLYEYVTKSNDNFLAKLFIFNGVMGFFGRIINAFIPI